jgi:hypothetical protein
MQTRAGGRPPPIKIQDLPPQRGACSMSRRPPKVKAALAPGTASHRRSGGVTPTLECASPATHGGPRECWLCVGTRSGEASWRVWLPCRLPFPQARTLRGAPVGREAWDVGEKRCTGLEDSKSLSSSAPDVPGPLRGLAGTEPCGWSSASRPAPAEQTGGRVVGRGVMVDLGYQLDWIY